MLTHSSECARVFLHPLEEAFYELCLTAHNCRSILGTMAYYPRICHVSLSALLVVKGLVPLFCYVWEAFTLLCERGLRYLIEQLPARIYSHSSLSVSNRCILYIESLALSHDYITWFHLDTLILDISSWLISGIVISSQP